MLEPIYTIPDVAKYLKLSRSKVYYLVQKKKIPHIKIGRNLRIRETDLLAWMNDLTVSNGTNPAQLRSAGDGSSRRGLGT